MDQIEEALRTALNFQVPKAVQEQALKALDNFKRSDQSGEWAFQVLGQPGRPLETRMFATKVLITLCNVKWRGWSETVQEQFRTAVMSLLELPSGREHPIVEAMGKVLGEVAEKQYPQQWPKMLEDMALAWESRGPAAATIVLSALASIAEDCVDSDFNTKLSTMRRTEILRAFNVELPILLPRLYVYLARVYENRATIPESAQVLRYGLGFIQRLVSWVSVDLILAPEANYLDVFRSLILEEPTRAVALECLRDLSGRRFENHDHLTQYMGKFEITMSELIGRADLWSNLVFSEMVCTTVSSFLSCNLDRFVCEDARFTTPQTMEYILLGRYLDLMVQLLQLKSLRAGTALLTGWSVVYRQEKLKSSEMTHKVLFDFLDAYCLKIVKQVYDEEQGCFPESETLTEECMDLEDYNSLLVHLRANVSPIFKVVAELYPHRAVDYLVNKLPTLITRYGAATGVTSSSEAYRYLESFANPMDRILGAIPEPDPSVPADVAMVNKISSLLTGLLDWQVSDPLLLYCHCLMLEAFRRFYRLLAPQLSAVLERLFQYMEYRDPALVGKVFPSPSYLVKALSPEALQVRRRGSNSIVEICNLVPDLLLPALPELCSRYQKLVQKGEVSNAHKPQIIEMLVAVSNAMTDHAQRTTFITDVLGDMLTFWTSQQATQTLSSCVNLLQCMGMRQDGTVGTTEEEFNTAWDNFHTITGAIGCFVCVARRLKVPTQDDMYSKDVGIQDIGRAMVFNQLTLEDLARVNPMVPIWTAILPNAMATLHCLHSIWYPETRARVLALPHARYALTVSNDELQTRLKASGPRPPVAAQGPDYLTKKWPMWLNQLRQHLYQLLERACVHKVIYYAGSEVLQRLEQAVVESLPHLEHRHVSWFVKNLMEPYIINCPQPLWATHLPPIMVPLMAHMIHRCTLTWSGADMLTNGMANQDPNEQYLVTGGLYICPEEGISTEDYDTMLDKLKREVTRSYLELLQMCFGQRGGVKEAAMEVHKTQQAAIKSSKGGGNTNITEGGATSPPPVAVAPTLKDFIESLMRFLVVENEQLAYHLLLSVLAGYCWPDASACRRLTSLTNALITVGAKEVKLYPAFGRELFSVLLRTLLSTEQFLSGLQNEIAATACQIYRLLVLGEDLKDTAAARAEQPICAYPREELLKLPGITPEHVRKMEEIMLGTRAVKDQRDAFRDLLRVVTDAISENGNGEMGKSDSDAYNSITDISNLPQRIIRRSRTLGRNGKEPTEGLQGTVFASLLGP